MRADFRQYIGAKNNKITKLKINDELSRRKRLMSFGLGRIFHQIQYKQLTMLNSRMLNLNVKLGSEKNAQVSVRQWKHDSDIRVLGEILNFVEPM